MTRTEMKRELILISLLRLTVAYSLLQSTGWAKLSDTTLHFCL